MNLKKILCTSILSIYTIVAFSQKESPFRISETDDRLWKIVRNEKEGIATAKQGILTLKSEGDLFYIYENTPAFRDISVEYKLTPQNEASHIGVLLRYISPEDWVYIGCDKTSDIFGYCYWYVETPRFRKEIARDIAKLYQNFTRTIRVDCIRNEITLRVDAEIVAHVNITGIPDKAGKMGFRVHQGGNVILSDITYKMLEELIPSTDPNPVQIASDRLKVSLSGTFPAPLSYELKGAPLLILNSPVYEYININGDSYPVVGYSTIKDRKTIRYTLRIPEVDITVEAEGRVDSNLFEVNIINIQEKGDTKVKTIGFPGLYLASMQHDSPGAMLAVAKSEGSDLFFPLNRTNTETIDQTGTIVILSNDYISVALDNNSVYESRQFVYRSDTISRYTSIGNNEWIYRGRDGKVTELPQMKAVFAVDRNGDRRITWQDAAVALSEIYPKPYGAETVRRSNITITMNFAGEAQYPFLRQLDNIKKMYFLTDGFGQMLELKGYQSEGHDSGHPDYAGHYNTRAGGLKDLQTLISEAKRYNAFIGVHINQSEAYPEAYAYNDRIVTTIPGWKWLDQAYLMNKEADVIDGTFQERLEQLKDDLPGLAFVYIDTYREHRYLAYNTARIFNQNGWSVWTEDPGVFNRYGSWVHYHPESKSLIARFIHHQRKDAFAPDSLFGGGYGRGAGIGFQGWQNGRDLRLTTYNFYTNQLPYRYLMHFPVLHVENGKAKFRNGVETRYEKGKTEMYDNGVLIMTGNIVFIPWDPVTKEKIYHYHPEGGTTSWKLPASWNNIDKVFCYKLTETGRKEVKELPVINDRIEIKAQKKTPYVIYKSKPAALLDADWSHGSPVKDMGFDSQGFTYWQKKGPKSATSIDVTSYGQSQLKIEGQKRAGVSQTLTNLEGGKSYSANVWVKIKGKRRAALEISGSGMEPAEASVEETTISTYVVNSDKRGDKYQRLRVYFTLPQGKNRVHLVLKAGAVKDSSFVLFDDVRVVETIEEKKKGYLFYEDFEQIDFGWGGFMLSKMSECKTHLSERNGKYTDDVINGNWSLKTLDQEGGEIIRTMPSFISFKPNTSYEIHFAYKAPTAGSYRIVVRAAKSGNTILSEPLDGTSDFHSSFQTDDATDYYVSIFKSGPGMLVIDDFGINEK